MRQKAHALQLFLSTTIDSCARFCFILVTLDGANIDEGIRKQNAETADRVLPGITNQHVGRNQTSTVAPVKYPLKYER